MKSQNMSFLKTMLYFFTLSTLFAIPLFTTWGSSLSEEDVKLWKMWINLARNGYTEPMSINRTGEKPWWRIW